MLSFRYLLKSKRQTECIFCDCPLTLHHIFLECSDTLPARNLLLNNVQTMRNLFTKVNISDILQFLWDFLQQNLKKFTLLHFLNFFLSFMSVRWDVKWRPMSRITTPLSRNQINQSINFTIQVECGFCSFICFIVSMYTYMDWNQAVLNTIITICPRCMDDQYS